MVIGFSATLALILMLLSIYYISRCLFNRRRRQDPDPEVSETSMILSSKELFLVLNPGGATTVAYREDEEQSMVPRSKTILVKSIVIDIEATSSSLDCLIPAHHSNGSSGLRKIHSECTEASGSGPSMNADTSERLHEAAEPDGKVPQKAERGSLETATSIVERGLPKLATDPLVVQENVPWANMHTTYNNTLFCHTPRNPQESASESDDNEPACQVFHI
ncbi:hypothetical protein COCOBI_01-5250 [Coccomyxa sp. Obi]|nr:hypothetical protein COCOBI_01-5250 [Coccomyxa sp. Obi]